MERFCNWIRLTLTLYWVFVFMSRLKLILAQNQIVFVNFYADWCRFSQILKPIFEEASEQFKDNAPGKVLFASVDCDRQRN